MQKQKGNISITRLNGKFLLLSMKIDDENNHTLFCKGASSGGLEDIAGKIFLEASPQNLIFQQHVYQKRLFWQIPSYLLNLTSAPVPPPYPVQLSTGL